MVRDWVALVGVVGFFEVLGFDGREVDEGAGLGVMVELPLLKGGPLGKGLE